ncbi:MAG: methylmalonyl-CoA mutase family protein, partial [Thermodesulfobacteriota bacterium]|nr:methylmalonyl-CoA mutase family protein [Thermodesulfobacteriota bacterium]
GRDGMGSKIKGIKRAYFDTPKRLCTWSNFSVKKAYTPEDIKDTDYKSDIGDVGEYPYTRGIFPDMYRGRIWSMREISGFGSGGDSNERLKYLMEIGETALNIIPDNPTQMGIDSDHPLAEGDVGVQGTAIDSLKDMEDLIQDIPLDEVSFMFSSPTIAVYAMYIAAAENQGHDISQLRGTFSNDPIGYLLFGNHTLEHKPPSMTRKLAVDVIEYCSKNMPRWNPINVNTYSLRETGVGAAHEMGYSFATALEYIREALKRGVDIDSVAPKIAFTCNAQIDLFEEVAKFRAARRLWARLMKEKLGAVNEKSWKFRFHTNTSGCSLVLQQPLNNITRVAYEALAAVLGGTQSLQTCSYDEPICLPTKDSQMIALRTQQILANEVGICNVADPLGGSYYVESLTNTLENEIIKAMEEVEEKGGMVASLEDGWILAKINDIAYQYQKEVDQDKRIIVGQNKYTIPEEEENEVHFPIHRICLDSSKEQIKNVKRLKESRDTGRVKDSLANLYNKAKTKDENLMYPIIEAAKAYAKLGEIMGTIRTAYGFHYDPFGEVDCPF